MVRSLNLVDGALADLPADTSDPAGDLATLPAEVPHICVCMHVCMQARLWLLMVASCLHTQNDSAGYIWR
jgi:hypothetical protein